MKNKLRRSRILLFIIFYFLSAFLTMADKVEFINEWNLGLDLEYWGSNGEFFSSMAFWLNMFLFSLLPLYYAIIDIKDKIVIVCTMALPMFWGYLLYRSIIEAQTAAGIVFYDIKYFLTGFLSVATIVIIVKLILIMRSMRVQQAFEDLENRKAELENFKKKALRKLSKVNPELNKKLLTEVFDLQEEARNLLIDAAKCYEDDDEKQRELMRLALHFIMMENESMNVLKKRLLMYSKISE